jgi:RNA recognition motif-containing protein
MPYEATVKDVESLFKNISDGIQAINMSVDPMTGRNPSYCFVDFKSKDLAERVMEEYNGVDFLRRPLKVKPGVKSGRGPRFQRSDNVLFSGRFESNRVYGSGTCLSRLQEDISLQF